MGGKFSVLVVDDEPDKRQLLAFALEAEGYEVHTADDGVRGLEAVAAHQPDLIVTDVMMPGMTGIELGREIRRRYPGTAILLTSGYSEVISREGAHGFDLLRKPYSMGELAAALRAATATSSYAGSAQ